MVSVDDRKRRRYRTLESVARISAALVGTLPVAVLAAAAASAYLPGPAGLRFAIGMISVIPLWVAAMTLVFLIRRGWLAWPFCVLVAVALALAVPEAVVWPSLP